MKLINKFGIGTLALALTVTACTKDFEALNTRPDVSDNVPPELLITSAVKSVVDRDFEWFYDNYQYLMRWTQFATATPTASTGGLFSPTNTNSFYKALYGDGEKAIGRNLSEIQRLVAAMPESQRTRYQHVVSIAAVIKVYAAWRVSDANGSIVYSEGWRAKDGLFTPRYDNQAALFTQWDKELKDAIALLAQDLPNQATYGAGDIFYSGNRGKWAKAANVLRLKIAMRLMKRDPEKVRVIAQEVVASPAGLFTAVEDEWKFIAAENSFANDGNWNVDGSPMVASKNMIDFMYDNADPRIRLFFQKNQYTQKTIDSLKKLGILPASTVYNPRQYVGLPASPDARQLPANAPLYATKEYKVKVDGKDLTVRFDTLSPLQKRLFDLSKDNISGGQYTQPILTYAELCFMMSELSVRGIIAQDAQSWFSKGVTASVKSYDRMAALAKIKDYEAVNDQEIQAYLAKPVNQLTGSADNMLEKIGVQELINLYKMPHEAWGTYKRTGYPKEGSQVLAFEPFRTNGIAVNVPRRWALPLPNIENRPNFEAAVKEMQQTGEYGSGIEDINNGRVWWDKK